MTNFEYKCRALRAKNLLDLCLAYESDAQYMTIYNLGRRFNKINPVMILRNNRPYSGSPSPFYSASYDIVCELQACPTFRISMTAKEIYATFARCESAFEINHWRSLLPRDFSWPRLWCLFRHDQNNRHSDVLWLILHRATRVRKSLYDWGYRVSSPNCFHCHRPETIEHCFLQCPRVRQLWHHFLPALCTLLGPHFLPNERSVFLLHHPDAEKSKRMRAIKLILSVLYHIWFSRVKATLHNSFITNDALIHMINLT